MIFQPKVERQASPGYPRFPAYSRWGWINLGRRRRRTTRPGRGQIQCYRRRSPRCFRPGGEFLRSPIWWRRGDFAHVLRGRYGI